MIKTVVAIVSLIALASVAGAGAAQAAVALRFLCFQERNECEVYADLLARFSEENPGITVDVEVAAEDVIHERLSAETRADAPPDFARVSDLDVLKGRYLNLRPLLPDPETLYQSFPDEIIFRSMSGDFQDIGLYGYPDAAKVVAPFVNLSRFEEAGVSVPGGGEDAASWDEWLAALDAVVEATGATYVLSVDNKDHRLAGPAMSMGADYYSAGLSAADLDGLRDFLQVLTELKDDAKTPADTLLGTGKSQEYFARGEALMYICGSWKVEEVAAQVGDDFAWTIVPNPSGAGGSTGVAQLTGLVALADTAQPEAVAAVFEYLSGPAATAEFAARTLTIPINVSIALDDIDYDTEDPVVAAALKAFAREVPRLQAQAIALDLHPLAPVYYEASNTYLRQYFAGELTLDEALAGLRERLEQAANSADGG